MKTVYPNLGIELEKIGVTVAILAEKLNISEFSVLEKLRGESEWTFVEVLRICKMVKNSDIGYLFCTNR